MKFGCEEHQNSNGFGGLLSLPNNKGKARCSFGFFILLARSPSGCVAGQSECHQKVRQSFARDQADGKQQFSASSVRDEKDPVFLN